MNTFLFALLLTAFGPAHSEPETLPVASRLVFSGNESTVWISEVDLSGHVLVQYNAHQEVRIELTNSLGQVCLRRVLEPSVSGAAATLALQRMPQGYYQLRVCCGEKDTRTVLIR